MSPPDSSGKNDGKRCGFVALFPIIRTTATRAVVARPTVWKTLFTRFIFMVTAACFGTEERVLACAAWLRGRGHACVSPASPTDLAGLRDDPILCLIDTNAAERSAYLAAALRHPACHLLLIGGPGGTAADLRRLGKAVKRRKCRAAILGGERFVPAFARLREIVASGVMGTIERVRVQVSSSAEGRREALFASWDLAFWLVGVLPRDETVACEEHHGEWILRRGKAPPMLVHWQPNSDGIIRETSIDIEAERGRLQARAAFAPAWPGKPRLPSRPVVSVREGEVPAEDERVPTEPLQRTDADGQWSSGTARQGLSVGHHPSLCQELEVIIDGRPRPKALPEADPAAAELGAAVMLMERDLPWHGLCGIDRAGRLLVMLP